MIHVTRVSPWGQVVIPKHFKDKLNIGPDSQEGADLVAGLLQSARKSGQIPILGARQ